LLQSLFHENSFTMGGIEHVFDDMINRSEKPSDDKATQTGVDPVSEDSTTPSLISLIISELECPVCYQPMFGPLHFPLLCPNGHPCCSSCSDRTRRICPTCRVSVIRWTRCLAMEKIGSLMVEEEQGERNLQGRGRTRSDRLEMARRHLVMWGRRGRGQPGRYWRGGLGMMGPLVVEERLEDTFDDSGYSDEEDAMDMIENDEADRTVVFAVGPSIQVLETIDEEIMNEIGWI
jgi:hypothetical protein